MPSEAFFKDGLQVALDAIPGTLTVPEASVIVVGELLERNGVPRPMVEATTLRGHVTLTPNGIHWQPILTAGQLSGLFDGTGVLRVRVTLKGHVIWTEDADRRLYLDGQAFGQPGLRTDKKTPRTALVFPSGTGEHTSDFESWFEIIQPLRIRAVTLSAAETSVGKAVGVTVALMQPAPPAPAPEVRVKLQSSNPAALSVPNELTIAAGSISSSVKVTPTAPGEVTITASLSGLSESAKLKVI
jgi:hypothetical protein